LCKAYCSPLKLHSKGESGIYLMNGVVVTGVYRHKLCT